MMKLFKKKEKIGKMDSEYFDSVKKQMLGANARDTYASGGISPNKYSTDQAVNDLFNNRTI